VDALQTFLTGDADRLCHVDYWGAIARIWVGTHAGDERPSDWRAIWERAGLAPGAREGLMGPRDRAAYAALPARVTVHRGFGGEDWRGLSWTRDRAAAERIARSLAAQPGTGAVATATVPREDVIALFGDRRAGELVVLPDGLSPRLTPVG
jgi:hypothetical protein